MTDLTPDMLASDRDLEEVCWALLRQRADICLDAGLEEEAVGWRWLAENRKWPVSLVVRPNPQAWGVRYGNAHSDKWVGWKVSAAGFQYELPGVIYNRLKGGKPRRTWRRFPTVTAALHAAAEAAGAWLTTARSKT